MAIVYFVSEDGLFGVYQQELILFMDTLLMQFSLIYFAAKAMSEETIPIQPLPQPTLDTEISQKITETVQAETAYPEMTRVLEQKMSELKSELSTIHSEEPDLEPIQEGQIMQSTEIPLISTANSGGMLEQRADVIEQKIGLESAVEGQVPDMDQLTKSSVTPTDIARAEVDRPEVKTEEVLVEEVGKVSPLHDDRVSPTETEVDTTKAQITTTKDSIVARQVIELTTECVTEQKTELQEEIVSPETAHYTPVVGQIETAVEGTTADDVAAAQITKPLESHVEEEVSKLKLEMLEDWSEISSESISPQEVSFEMSVADKSQPTLKSEQVSINETSSLSPLHDDRISPIETKVDTTKAQVTTLKDSVVSSQVTELTTEVVTEQRTEIQEATLDISKPVEEIPDEETISLSPIHDDRISPTETVTQIEKAEVQVAEAVVTKQVTEMATTILTEETAVVQEQKATVDPSPKQVSGSDVHHTELVIDVEQPEKVLPQEISMVIDQKTGDIKEITAVQQEIAVQQDAPQQQLIELTQVPEETVMIKGHYSMETVTKEQVQGYVKREEFPSLPKGLYHLQEGTEPQLLTMVEKIETEPPMTGMEITEIEAPEMTVMVEKKTVIEMEMPAATVPTTTQPSTPKTELHVEQALVKTSLEEVVYEDETSSEQVSSGETVIEVSLAESDMTDNHVEPLCEYDIPEIIEETSEVGQQQMRVMEVQDVTKEVHPHPVAISKVESQSQPPTIPEILEETVAISSEHLKPTEIVTKLEEAHLTPTAISKVEDQSQPVMIPEILEETVAVDQEQLKSTKIESHFQEAHAAPMAIAKVDYQAQPTLLREILEETLAIDKEQVEGTDIVIQLEEAHAIPMVITKVDGQVELMVVPEILEETMPVALEQLETSETKQQLNEAQIGPKAITKVEDQVQPTTVPEILEETVQINQEHIESSTIHIHLDEAHATPKPISKVDTQSDSSVPGLIGETTPMEQQLASIVVSPSMTTKERITTSPEIKIQPQNVTEGIGSFYSAHILLASNHKVIKPILIKDKGKVKYNNFSKCKASLYHILIKAQQSSKMQCKMQSSSWHGFHRMA